jgi:hypothetical protein
MVELIAQQERPVTPEKSREELYAGTLRLKRDVLSSHYAMNSLRREINERIDEMGDEEFKNDLEVVKYGKVNNEYNKRRKLFLESLEGLPEEDKDKLSGLTSLTKVEVELSALGGLEKIPEHLLFRLKDALEMEQDELEHVAFEIKMFLKDQNAGWGKLVEEQKKAADTLIDS